MRISIATVTLGSLIVSQAALAAPCLKQTDCGPTEYCDFATATGCGDYGKCESGFCSPQSSDPYVCGCDGNWYSSPCGANYADTVIAPDTSTCEDPGTLCSMCPFGMVADDADHDGMLDSCVPRTSPLPCGLICGGPNIINIDYDQDGCMDDCLAVDPACPELNFCCPTSNYADLDLNGCFDACDTRVEEWCPEGWTCPPGWVPAGGNDCGACRPG